MTPGTTTLGNAESGSAGKSEATTGYRWWLVENGRLVSPFAGITLRPNGIAFGVSYYATPTDMDRVATLLNRRTTALTIGTITGSRPDPEPQTYDIDGTMVTLPDAWIADTYRVRTIATNASGLLYPGIPVTRWPS